MPYASLHNHSMYSLLDGYATPKEYLTKAQEVGVKAFAITEHGNQYSWCYFDKLKDQFPDIKIIYGIEFYECNDISVKDKNDKYYHLIALARNEDGRKAINQLITRSNFEGFYYKPRVDLSMFEGVGENLVVSSACLASKLAREQDIEKCVEYVCEYKRVFPYFYLEMQSHSNKEQSNYNKKILTLSQFTNTPFIITTDSHAASKEDLYYQGKLVQIAHDSETASELYEGCYLQTEEEIHSIMDKQIGAKNVEIGLKNTLQIASLIEDVKMPFQSPKLPTFPLPEGFKDNYSYLKHLVDIGWKDRGFDKFSIEKQKQYRERLEYELDIIHTMGFDGYFLIVWDFINYAKSQKVMVAPGRGSCAGSLVCFALHITDLDPIKYGLIFERFLNPERISMPDTDTDVSDRATVINYLLDKYGEDRVCQIINFSYITPVVAIKDVGKILGFNYADMDKLSKRFVFETFSECMENNADFLAENPQYAELIDIASKLSGRVKTVSCHAGGVGIVDTNINDYMGMKLGGDGEHVIQVDKRIIEEIGIIKFDILGVKTLSMIKEILEDTGLSQFDISINNPQFENDTKPFEILNSGYTNGVFQVESAGMKDILLGLHANSIKDLSAVLALYRPDSMSGVADYIERKNSGKTIEYFHEDLAPILSSTYGCLIYQEQLMDIVRKFGGRTYGGADKFRKGIGKKDKQLVQQESDKLYQEIIDNGYSEEVASHISNEMREKGGYLFNASHSQSYAVVCFQTAFLKYYYPTYFFKALFNLNKDKSGMINKYIIDAKHFNVEVLPPNINRSDINFSVVDNKILFGLSAIKGIGEHLAEDIIKERNTNGDFSSFNDFAERVKPTKTQVISLFKAGAFPTKDKMRSLQHYLMSLYDEREFKPLTTLPSPYSKIEAMGISVEQYRNGKTIDKERLLKEVNRVKQTMFVEKETQRKQEYQYECSQKYLQNKDFWEFEALQIFINNNPFDKAYSLLQPFENVEIGDKCTIVGIISKVQKKKDKNKKQFAYVNVYSSFGLVEGIVWHSTLRTFEDLIKVGAQLAFLVRKDGEEKVVIDKVKPYAVWIKQKFMKEGV